MAVCRSDRAFESCVIKNWFYFKDSSGAATWIVFVITNHVKHISSLAMAFCLWEVSFISSWGNHIIWKNLSGNVYQELFLNYGAIHMAPWFKGAGLPFQTLVFEHFYFSSSKCNVLKPGTWIANWDESFFFFFIRIGASGQAISFFNVVSGTFLVIHK